MTIAPTAFATEPCEPPAASNVRRPRILLVDLSCRHGGTDVRVQTLLAGLTRDFEVHLALLAGSEFARRVEAGAATLWPLEIHPKNPKCVRLIADLIAKVKPDLIDAHNPQSILWGLTAARLTGLHSRVATIHSVYEDSEQRLLRSHLYRVFPKLIRPLATRAIAVSDNVQENLTDRGFPADRIDVIMNGIPATNNPGAVKTIPSDVGHLRVAVVARLISVKGHRFLIEAIAQLRSRVARLSCVLIGDGGARASLQAQCRDMGVEDVVTFAGYQSNVEDHLSRCDVLCLPSLTEGLPYAVLEAGLLNIPVVASRVGGLNRYFRHRETALLTRPGHVKDLHDKLLWCSENPRDAFDMATRARKMITRDFSVDKMICQTRLAYMRMIEENAAKTAVPIS